MLEELKKLENPIRKEGILYFFLKILGNKKLTFDVIDVLCKHAPREYHLHANAVINYCSFFNWINIIDNKVMLTDKLLLLTEKAVDLNYELINLTINNLYSSKILHEDTFVFDINYHRYIFLNEEFSIEASVIRDTLIDQGFIEIIHSNPRKYFVNQKYEAMLSIHSDINRKTISYEELMKKMEKNEIAGEKAEIFVYDFEKKRLSNENLVSKIRIISKIDVCAGYDIVSYNNEASVDYDRFIEVKAISEKMGFYWSDNEYTVAKLKGSQYYLYLVDLSKIENDNYSPFIVPNPAKILMESDVWLIETKTYFIRHI